MSANALKAPAGFATREAWLVAFTSAARPVFAEAGFPLPAEIRVSIGFASSGKRSKTIGECWYAENSADKHAEIFIVPSLQSETSRIADVLTHELIHAALGAGHGHGPKFKKAMRALGLEGKATATVAGAGWYEWAQPILDDLGPLPGAALSATSETKKQGTRMLKLECDDCGFSCRTTAKHLEAADVLVCPTQCGGLLERKG